MVRFVIFCRPPPMGIKWSQPRPVRGGASIMMTSAIPTNTTLRSKIWTLWKTHKVELKVDGFSIRKYNETWSISYFQNIMPDSYDKVDNEPKYMTIFRKIYAKWQKAYEEDPKPIKTMDDDDDMPWFLFFLL
jgi:hypothetical protein